MCNQDPERADSIVAIGKQYSAACAPNVKYRTSGCTMSIACSVCRVSMVGLIDVPGPRLQFFDRHAHCADDTEE